MPAEPVLITSAEEVSALVAELVASPRQNVAIDTEFDTYTPTYAMRMAEKTNRKPRVFGHSPETTVGMSICASNDKAYYIPLREIYSERAASVGKQIVVSLGVTHGKTLWAWNWKAEWRSLGIDPSETQAKYYDAMVLAWLLEAGSPFYDNGKLRYKYELKATALHLLSYEMTEFSEVVAGKELVAGVTEEENNAIYEQEIREIHAKFAPKPPTKKALNEARKAYNRRAKENVYRKRMVGDLHTDAVYKYACADAWATYALASRLVATAKQEGMWDVFRSVEVPTTRIIYSMEQRGIAVDVPYFLAERNRLQERVRELEAAWFALAGCDIRSATQCADALYNRLKCWRETPSSRTAKGNLAVNKRALAVALDTCAEGSLGRRLALIKQEHSKLFKLVTAYMSEFVFQGQYTEDKRVHAKTIQIGTNTGRFSMKNPNLQSTPKEIIRKGIVAPEGRVFCCGDWSSLEIVVMGHFSKDAKIAEIVLSGKSQHDITAEGVGVDRQVGKILNFGLNYGGGAATIARTLNVPLEPMRLRSGEVVMAAPAYIREWVKKYAETYEGVMAWRARVAQECAQTGYVQTLSGRKRRLPGIYSSESGEKAGAERQAYNTPIQGTAAEIAKVSMVALDAWLRANTPTAFIVLQVHDELLVECDEADGPRIKKAMEDIMANTIKLDLPLKAEVKLGKSWEDAK